MIVALTNSDEVNMVACDVAWRLFRVRTKIARIRSLAYTSRPELFYDTNHSPAERGGFPVDVYVNPEELVTQYVERLIRYSGALQVLDFAEGRVRLVGVRSVHGGPLVGQKLRSLRKHLPNVDARVVAIYRSGTSIPPDGDAVITPGDEIFFLAATEDMRRVMTELRRVDDAVKRVVIAGGGNIGLRLAQRIDERYQVKIIERDPARARRISQTLRNTVVLNGDAADEELLIEENIDSADVFCAVTNTEEANILSAMLAKRLGAHRVMALINRPVYAEMMESGPIDVAISPQSVTIGSLLAHVRRGDVVRVHSLRRGAAEAMEAIAHGTRGGKVVGRRVEEVKLPKGATIGAIVRGQDVLMCHHDTVIEADDHVIVFLADRRHVEQVERLFQA
jgi:trk system potassium uptake protein TrkA